jgi:septal ring factor EnvC (AmiA/AmiB activator)
MDWAIDRLQQLRGEYAAGESQLAELDLHREHVRAQLHRIEGAIRVLEEQLAADPSFASSFPSSSAAEPARA